MRTLPGHRLRRAAALSIATLLVVAAGCQDQVPTQTSGDLAASRTDAAARGAGNADESATKRYRITVENLTTGQPLSPGVAVTHVKQTDFFRVGETAPAGLRNIAENGDPSTAVADLTGATGIFDVQVFPQPTGPIHRIGGPGATSGSVEIEARANANRVSLAIMLICTNDGFTGLESVKLPGGWAAATHYSDGYDAGTEANEETADSLVPPCGLAGPVAFTNASNTHTGEDEVVRHHPGISVGGVLTAEDHGWTDPVAKITIQRVQ